MRTRYFIWRHAGRRSSGLVALIALTTLVVMVAARYALALDPWAMVGSSFEAPSAAHWFGTDSFGRDVLSGIVSGASTSLFVGVAATALSAVVGIAVGAIAGYCGGLVDECAMRVTEMFQVYPAFILTLVLVAIFSPHMTSIIASIAVASWPGTARLMRAEFLSLRGREFVLASIAAGASDMRVVISHMLPNALPPVVVHSSMTVATAILTEAGLSFLGLGDPNEMTWGYMIGTSRVYLRHAWWTVFFPGLAIVVAVLGFSLIGDALNDVLRGRTPAEHRG